MSHLNNAQIAEKKKHIRHQRSTILNDKKLHGNMEEPRTKQKNTKFPAQTIEEEQTFREDAVEEQIKIWRNLLPSLLEKLSRIPEQRNPKKIKHKGKQHTSRYNKIIMLSFFQKMKLDFL